MLQLKVLSAPVKLDDDDFARLLNSVVEPGDWVSALRRSRSTGDQTIAPGGRVREHSHGDQVELQICFRGRGRVMVDGVGHPLVPGTACFLGYDVTHEIVNEGDEDLVMLWVITPPGLEDSFRAIGRPQQVGAPAPAPFARPDDVVAIERAMGMQNTRPWPAPSEP